MNQYQQLLYSALQSRIDQRGERLADLEAFRCGFKALGRHDKRRECDNDLLFLKLDQCVDKRVMAAMRGQERYIAYLEDVACAEFWSHNE